MVIDPDGNPGILATATVASGRGWLEGEYLWIPRVLEDNHGLQFTDWGEFCWVFGRLLVRRPR